MRRFNYEARDQATNKIVKAALQADSEQSAAQLLTKQGMIPLNIKEDMGDGGFLGSLKNRITAKDKVVFSRQLATLIGAGLPLSQSLHTVAEQTQNKHMQSIIEDIAASVEGGRPLSESFGKYPKVFNEIFLSLVAAGELSGTLDEALRRIADQQEKDAAIASKIRGAMTYPVIVLGVIIAVLVFMVITVVPEVQKLYEDMGEQLPFLTAALVALSEFIINFWWLVVLILGAAIFFGVQFIHTDSGIEFKDKFKLNVPLFGSMFRKLYMGRFARTGQTLLSTGVSMLDMLNITGRAVNNTIVEKSIVRATDKVKGGKALSTALEPEEVILPLVPQMIKIGEQSGRIDEMMGKVAKVYEDELDEEIRNISTAIEPVLMIIMAVLVGGMVGAILFPIYALVQNVQI